jgi:hypothetical protein
MPRLDAAPEITAVLPESSTPYLPMFRLLQKVFFATVGLQAGQDKRAVVLH